MLIGESINMNYETLFLYLIAAASLLFAAYNALYLILKRNRTARTTGTIISITSPNPDTAKARNSKWAVVSYKVNGKNFTSENRIQVPMAAQIGSPVTVRYDIERPKKLYSFSLIKIFTALLVAAVSVIAAAFYTFS